MMGVCVPHVEGGKKFCYGIGCDEKYVKAVPEGYSKWEVPAGSWAVFKCVGAMPHAIQNMWKRIYAEWLPQAKYEMKQSFDFEFYPEGDKDSPDYVSEIWIPVKEK